MTRWLALDIGGANLKCADGLGFVRAVPFAMWKQSAELPSALRQLIHAAPDADHLAVTMTGELADCFTSKRDGVRYILDAVTAVAEGRVVSVYMLPGSWVTVRQAALEPLRVAAANWHALARFGARYARTDAALMIDIGSTTVDIVPLRARRVCARGATDLQRIEHGELVYTGAQRSPVCALAQTLPFQSRRCTVAQELFATTRDVYLLLGDEPEQPDDRNTADGEPATIRAAHRRMARLLCADQEDLPLDTVRAWAEEIAASQAALISSQVRRVLQVLAETSVTAIVSGHGAFLAHRVLNQLPWTGPVVYLHEHLAPSVSRCASAHALAVLARETTSHTADFPSSPQLDGPP